MAVVDMDPVRGRDELDDLAGMERPIDLGQRVAARDPVLDDGVGDLAEGVAHGVHALDVAIGGVGMFGGLAARPVGTFDVDQAAIGEPREGVIERRQRLVRETILGVEGVQEVEGGVDADVVRVARRASVW